MITCWFIAPFQFFFKIYMKIWRLILEKWNIIFVILDQWFPTGSVPTPGGRWWGLGGRWNETSDLGVAGEFLGVAGVILALEKKGKFTT